MPSRESALEILRERLAKATEESRAASERFNAVVNESPSGVPHPDGSQRIYNASREYSAAFAELMRAMERLNNLIVHDTVPDDLKDAQEPDARQNPR